MKKIKLTAGILVMLMITSSIVFSQTSNSTQNQKQATQKTTAVKTDQNYAGNNTVVASSSQSTQNKEVRQKNFVDKNNDGICDNCGKKKSECTEATCKEKQANGKGCCPKGQKSGCAKECKSHH